MTRKQGHTPEGWTPAPRSTRSGGMAVFLSLLLVGLGHFYAGSPARGAVWFLGGVVLAVLTAGIAAPFIYIFAAVDAFSCARNAK